MGSNVLAATLGIGAIAVFSVAYVSTVRALPANDSTALEAVVVTAQRKEESAESIGIALSVIGGDQLRDKDIARINDLANATPSLEVEPAFGSGQPQFRLRGVGFIDYSANNSSPVGMYVDQVSLPFPVQTQGELFDINRIEVLRGPQGTLYGRNTTGGAVNFVTNKPTADDHAGISVEYGSHHGFNAEGFVSGALSDTLNGRISWATSEGGAWQRNRDTGAELGNQDKIAARTQFDWTPAQGVELLLNVHFSQDKSDAQGLQLFQDYNPGKGVGPVIPADPSPYLTGWSLEPSFAKAVGVGIHSRPGLNNSNNGIDLTANVDLDGAKITSISAYNKFIRRELGDWDATQYAQSDVYYRDDIKVFSQEFRVASTGSGPFGWLGGAYYSDEKLDENFYSDFDQSPLVGGTAHTSYTQVGKSAGLFGQTNFQFTDQLRGILGLRFEHEKRNLNDLNTGFAVPAISLVIPTLAGPQSREFSNNDVSGKVGLEYQIMHGTLLYATVSRGVKSGGFTTHNTTNGAEANPFAPEKLLAYEVGVKSDVSSSLRINASVFYYDYRDEQILSKAFDPVSQSFIGIFVNVPKSKIQGAELEATWRPLPGLDIEQYAGYKQGTYKSSILNGDTPPKDFNGQDLSFPKLSYGGDASYGIDVGAYTLTPEVNYSYHDKYSQLFLLGPDYTVDAYWLANANLTLTPKGGKSWSAALWVRNLADKQYYLTKNFFLPNSFVGDAGEPTTFGIRASYSY